MSKRNMTQVGRLALRSEGEWVECWQCGGEGLVSSCLDDGACIDPEGGCELCLVNCDICEGAGGWNAPEPDNA